MCKNPKHSLISSKIKQMQKKGAFCNITRTKMFLLIFGIEGHGTQLYFDICELPIGVAFWLAPFLRSLRPRSWLLVLPLLPLTMTPCFTLRPWRFEGTTVNLQTGNCLGFATKPHACQHADSTVSQTYRQRSNRDEHGYEHAKCSTTW